MVKPYQSGLFLPYAIDIPFSICVYQIFIRILKLKCQLLWTAVHHGSIEISVKKSDFFLPLRLQTVLYVILNTRC